MLFYPDCFQAHKKVQSEIDQAKAQVVDLERSERQVRVDLEQCSKRVSLW